MGLAIGLVGGYNWARFGDPLDSGYDPDEVFSTPFWEGGGGLLFSLHKGLFWFNPVLLLSVWGGVNFWKCHRREALLVLGALLVHLALFGAWWNWWGGESWGPRFLAPTLPLLILLVLPSLAGGGMRWIVGVIVVLSVMAQAIAFLAPDTYLPGWSDESFRAWFLPANWALSNWPFIGHLLRFDMQELEFAWLWWSEAGVRHLDGLLLGGLLLNGTVVGAGLLAFLRGYKRFPVWIGVGTWLAVTVLLLVRIEPDPRYIRKLDAPSAHQAAYDALLAQLPPDATLILTDKRFEPYFFNHHVTSNVWYTLAKPRHTETLSTVSYLLEQQGGRVALITDDLDNTLLPYAIEQWLARRGSRLFRQTFGGKAQMTVFQLQPSEISGDPIPPTPVFDYTADPGTATFQGIASLLGWDVAMGEGGRSYFTVYWIHRGKAPGEPFFLRLVKLDGKVVSEGVANAGEEAAMMGQMMMAQGEMEIPADLPAGDYFWQVGIYTAAVESGELVFDLPREITVCALP